MGNLLPSGVLQLCKSLPHRDQCYQFLMFPSRIIYVSAAISLDHICGGFLEFLNFILFFIQQVLISYPFYTYQCIHVSPNLPIHPTTTTTPATFPPWCPYVCSLHLCLYFYPANQFICTIFLGSTYMR